MWGKAKSQITTNANQTTQDRTQKGHRNPTKGGRPGTEEGTSTGLGEGRSQGGRNKYQPKLKLLAAAGGNPCLQHLLVLLMRLEP